jgi:hypothetical protein
MLAKGEVENRFQTDLTPSIEKFMNKAVLIWKMEHECANIRNTKSKVHTIGIVAYDLLLTTCCLRLVAYNLLLTTCCLRLVAYDLLLTTCCLRLVAYDLLLTTCHYSF